jgi:hypothetical protein
VYGTVLQSQWTTQPLDVTNLLRLFLNKVHSDIQLPFRTLQRLQRMHSTQRSHVSSSVKPARDSTCGHVETRDKTHRLDLLALLPLVVEVSGELRGSVRREASLRHHVVQLQRQGVGQRLCLAATTCTVQWPQRQAERE